MSLKRLGRKRRRRRIGPFTRSMLREIPRLLRLLLRLLGDPRVALVDKLLFGAVVAYTLTPADLLPDVFAPLGLVDDLYLLGLSLARLLRSAGPDLLLEHWDGDPGALGYLVEGIEEIGGGLPAPVRRVLRRTVRKAG